MDSAQAFTHISLCAGYGGIDLGLARIIRNLRTIAFSEIEAFPCANLVAKMEAGFLDAAPIWTNLKTFPFSEFRGKVGILSGGFPCQPFSAAGKRGGDEDPRHLFPYILRGITEGIISAKLTGGGWRDPAGTPVLLHVLRELERVGYRATAGVFSSAEVGATHQRKRVFILGRKMADAMHDGRDGTERPSGARPSVHHNGTFIYDQSRPDQTNGGGNQPESFSQNPEADPLWPTPRAGCPGSRPNLNGGKVLEAEAKQWATPRSCSAMAVTITPESVWNQDRFPNLETQVGQVQRNTPQARDWKGLQGRAYKGDAKDLPAQIESMAATKSGQLNPRWVETLMGLPIGWTAPSCQQPWTVALTNSDSLETALTPLLPQKRS